MNPHNIPSTESFRCHTDVQIRFNDIDILGHVNNTVYFGFFDTGKAYYLRDTRNGNINFKKVETVIANIDCAFINPIFFDQQIEVLTRCESMSEKSFKLLQMIVEKRNGRVCAIAETVMVAIDPETQRATEIPQSWRDDFSRYEGRQF